MNDWQNVPLETLFSKSMPGEWGNEPTGSGTDVIVYRGADFNRSGRFKITDGVSRQINNTKFESIKLQDGDIVLEKSGGSPDQPVGRVMLFDGLVERATCSNFAQLLRPAINPAFAFYLMSFLYETNRVYKYQQKTTGIINFKLRDYMLEQVLIPTDINEQRRIAEILSTVDEQIESVAIEIKKKEVVRNGLMHNHFKSNGSSIFSGAIEDALEALIDYRGKSPVKTSEGVPLITAKVVKSGRVLPPDEFIAANMYSAWMTRGIPLPGDVLFTTEAPLGEVALAPSYQFALAQRLICLRGSKDILNNHYLLYLLQSPDLARQMKGFSSGSTVTGIKQSEFRRIKIELPSLTEQVKVAHTLSQCDEGIDYLNEKLVKLQTLKSGLMNDLLTGKVQVSV